VRYLFIAWINCFPYIASSQNITENEDSPLKSDNIGTLISIVHTEEETLNTNFYVECGILRYTTPESRLKSFQIGNQLQINTILTIPLVNQVQHPDLVVEIENKLALLKKIRLPSQNSGFLFVSVNAVWSIADCSLNKHIFFNSELLVKHRHIPNFEIEIAKEFSDLAFFDAISLTVSEFLLIGTGNTDFGKPAIELSVGRSLFR
jgi:hypothetical protein